MVLEMAGAMPECLDDLRAWQPKTYAEHFAASRFSNRDAIIAAYQAADPAVRGALDRSAELLNALAERTPRSGLPAYRHAPRSKRSRAAPWNGCGR